MRKIIKWKNTISSSCGLDQLKISVCSVHCRNYSKKHTSPPDSFLNGTSIGYVEELYKDWLKDPTKIHSSWDQFFRDSDKRNPQASNLGPRQQTQHANFSGHGGSNQPPIDHSSLAHHQVIHSIIRSYQARGHLIARTNPLESNYDEFDKMPIEEKFKTRHNVFHLYNIVEFPMDVPIQLPKNTMVGGEERVLTARELFRRLENTYCRHIGVEYMHISNIEERDWIRKQFESPGNALSTKKEKRTMLKRLGRATWIEDFFALKFPTEKRFGSEGGEIAIPCLQFIMDQSVVEGAETFIMGMAHRGRLSVLANIVRVPLKQILTFFVGLLAEDSTCGDIKYHMGAYVKRKNRSTGKQMIVSLQPNPSHLACVYPVTVGRARGQMFLEGDKKGEKIVPIVMHGDAALSGQGIGYETIQFAYLENYGTHGVIHLVLNNQVGFTAEPHEYKSARYCTDIAKIVDAPIFHVNSDDPESVIFVSKIAAQWRAKFHKDVVIDLVAYRRLGHSEDDNPNFTSPHMYKKIKAMKTNFEKFSEKCLGEGIVTPAEIQSYKEMYRKLCDDGLEAAKKEKAIRTRDWVSDPKYMDNLIKIKSTGVSEDIVSHIAERFSHPPPALLKFNANKLLDRVFKARQELVSKKMCDWAMGEAVAIGSLLKEGIHVRISGEDTQRGTFSHRHHVLHDTEVKDKTYTYLNDLYPAQAHYTNANSVLSEYGALGFEHGFSTTSANYLVMWEAQYGDFANGAQIILDQFICSGEEKWKRPCGMVVSLPHGLEGAGPEHSSARIERYLLLCNDDPDYLPPLTPDLPDKQLEDTNWILANCSTPANYFHILRRQIFLPFRRPLLLFMPKSLLRDPRMRSPYKDFLENVQFKRLIPDDGPASKNPKNIKKLIFCSGKVYFFITERLEKEKCSDKIAVSRVEQLAPFPYDLVIQECSKYPNAQIIWAQEEHKNSGCWEYMKNRFETALKGERDIVYIGRPVSPTPATGYKKLHLQQIEKFLQDITKFCKN